VNWSRRNLRRQFSCPKCTIRSGETVYEKTLAISEANRFSRRGRTCRPQAIFPNQPSINLRYQEKLSSLSVGMLRPETTFQLIRPHYTVDDQTTQPLR
jgi:hypothetical protein